MKKWFVLMIMLVFLMVPGAAIAADLVPTMTGDATPSPYVANASGFYGTNYPWKAFNDDYVIGSGHGWYIYNLTPPTGGHWLKIDLGNDNRKVVCKIALVGGYANSTYTALKDWSFYGSNDDINYIELTQGTTPNDYNRHEYTFNNNIAYRYYRINILSSYYTETGKTVGITEMEFEDTVAPTNLTATSGNAKINLSWDTVAGATGYNIKRKTDNETYSIIEPGHAGTSYEDKLLTNGTTYYYVVTALTASGESSVSNEVYATPSDGFSLTGDYNDSKVSLAWDEVSGATSYDVYKSTDDANYTKIISKTSLMHDDISITSGETYYYYVTTTNTDGQIYTSNIVTITTGTLPPPTGRAVLWVTMNNSSDIDYDVSMDEVYAFINWYKSKASGGVGDPFYTFKKTPISPYTSRTDYLIFDKIVCFKVNQY